MADPSLVQSMPLTDIQAAASQCVKCGMCLPVCPTYRLAQVESQSPRGRISQAQWLMGHAEDFDPQHDALNDCLQCGQCEQVCPSKVKVVPAVSHARALGLAGRPNAWPRRWVIRLLSMGWLHRSPMAWLVAGMRLLPWPQLLNPPRWHQMMRGLSHSQIKTKLHFPSTETPLNDSGSVLLWAGCTGEALDRDTLVATQLVLNKLRISFASINTCCGALAEHAGEQAMAESTRRQAQSILSSRSNPTILTLASGCHTAIDALQSNHNTLDVMQWMQTHAGATSLALKAPIKAAWWAPCTQRGNPAAIQATRALLEKIEGLEWIELPASIGCCGAGGVASLHGNPFSDRLAEEVIAAVKQSGATLLLTGNIGCRLHLSARLKERNESFAVWHPVRLLSEAMQ